MKAPRSESLLDYLERLKRDPTEPGRGLPDAVFELALKITPMINVDLLIRDETGRTLMAWREDRFGRGWHIPGGIIRHRESFAQRIAEVARLELGAPVHAEAAPCHVVELREGERGHFISLLFRCAFRERQPGIRDGIAAGPAPEPDQLAWFATAPDALYWAHEIYRDWIDPAGPGRQPAR